MTYGVPYSFVPGTKAKADEVNANFIDILDKIENTNSRINETNTLAAEQNGVIENRLQELNDQKLELDLSNLDETGQSILNAKANANLLDGTWVKKHETIADNVNIAPGKTLTYSISNYLPDSTNKYEILVGICGQPAATSSSTIMVYIKTDFLTTQIPFCRTKCYANNSTSYASGQCTLLSSTGRSVSLVATSGQSGTAIIKVELFAYRKVR